MKLDVASVESKNNKQTDTILRKFHFLQYHLPLCKRMQFLLLVAFSINIHKAQGLKLDRILDRS